MSSRDKILKAAEVNQPAFIGLPDITAFKGKIAKATDKFIETLTAIGCKAVPVTTLDEIKNHFSLAMDHGRRNVTTMPSLSDMIELIDRKKKPDGHSLYDVDNAVIKAHFGVAENGAVWVTDDLLMLRVLPFICQHLAVVVNIGDIVQTMHEAYDKIGDTQYTFGTFIAGPSKTADIEQALVLGAHGPRSMTVYLMV